MRDAFIRALTALAEKDPKVVLITGDLGFGVLTDFAARFPDQFINAGVAEQNMTAIACGMALEGYSAYTYSIANFPTLRCLEQIRNDVCYHDADVTVVAVGGGFSYGQLGMSHFATEDMAIMGALPNMEVIVPADPWEAEALTHQMATRRGPKYLRIDKGAAGLAPEPDVTLGKPRVYGDGDLVIVAIGGIVKEALSAQETLKGQGVAVRVVVLNALKPLDPAPLLAAIGPAKTVITLEEHNTRGGLGTLVADAMMTGGLRPDRCVKLGLQDCYPSQVGDQDFLRNAYGMSAAHVVKAALG